MENSEIAKSVWFLYLLECNDRRIYTGITNDLIRRFKAHSTGKGSVFTRANRPIRFIGYKEYPNHSIAAKAEATMKKQSREFKLAWSNANPVSDDVDSATIAILQQCTWTTVR